MPAAGLSTLSTRTPTCGLAHQVRDWLAAGGVQLVVSYPSLGVDRLLSQLDELEVPMMLATSERAAMATAEGFSASTGSPAAILIEQAWAAELRPPQLGTATVHVMTVSPEPVAGWTVTSSSASAVRVRPPRSMADDAPPGHPSGLARRVAVLPPTHTRYRYSGEMAALAAGLPCATCATPDPFPTRHPDRWAGRIGFLPSAGLRPGRDLQLLALPGALVPPAWGNVLDVAPADLASLAELPEARDPLVTDPLADLRVPAPPRQSPMALALGRLSDLLPCSPVVADAGAAHRVVAAHIANAGRPAVITDGLTPMGWSLAAAIGVCAAQRLDPGSPGQPVIAVIGDGAAGQSLAELALIASRRLPVAIVLGCNATLGDRTGRGPGGTDLSLPDIDWLALASSIGLPARSVPSAGTSPDVFKWARDQVRSGRPALVVVPTPAAHPADVADPVGIAAIDGQPGGWLQGSQLIGGRG